VTAVTGLKRLGLAIAIAGAAVFGALAVVSYLIPADQVREAVKAQIRAATGLDPVLRGPAAVSLFPYGSVTFEDVALGEDNSGPPALAAERLVARLQFFPLLAGHIEIADVALRQPRIFVTIDAGGRSNWSGLIASLSRTLSPDPARGDALAGFSEFRIGNGIVTIRDDARGVIETLNDVDMSFAWPSISRSFAATGRFDWRGEAVDASVTLADFAAALKGDRSGLKIRLASPLIKFAFDGAMGRHPTAKIDGTFSADAASLREALVWLGQRPLPGGGFGRFALKAQTNVVGGTIALSAVNLDLDGNSAEGVLTFAADGRQTLQGTLAADTLDLTPYLSTIRLLAANNREWNRVPIVLDGLTGMDFDLRLSAAKVALAGAKIGRTAIAANLLNGKLTVTVGESEAFGGILKGSLVLAKSAQGAELKSQLQFSDVDLESCIGELFGIRRLEGKGSLGFAIEASGGSVYALTRTLTGSATLSGRQGAIAGLNVEQLLRRLERRPLSGGGEFRNGRTPFDKLTVSIKIAQGTAAVEEMSLEGAAVRLAMAGSTSIPARELDLKGTASLIKTSASAAETAFELPFVVQGPWDDPIMLPDPQSLINRSGAAAPLLKAVQDRRARDALRAAIQRLTGGQPDNPVPAASPPIAPVQAPAQ
jgi:AsmA protein